MSAMESARAVADAVLYEGYVLYPYRANSSKNQVRWQWGVLMPPGAVALDPSERSANRTDVLIDGRAADLQATVRFLHVQHRYVENAEGQRVDRLDVDDATYREWDEAREENLELPIPLAGELDTTMQIPGGTEIEELPQGAGRLVRVWEPLTVRIVATTHQPTSPYAVTGLTVRVENQTASTTLLPADRPQWLRHSLVACHLLFELTAASFISLLDPPQWAKGFVDGCTNDGVFPVLAGPAGQATVVLSSPIILYDHPELAPQSESSFFDGLEIDELLSLRTMTLSEDEKREVRGTDAKVAALLDEVEGMPAELWERLHGTVRYLDAMTALAPPPKPSAPLDAPWWDPGSDSSVDPENDTIRIGDVDVHRGTRVVLRPGVRGADAYDLFLAGLTATVAAVLHDVDGKQHLAVTVDEDPGADLKATHGRYLYFSPDEVEPLAEVGS